MRNFHPLEVVGRGSETQLRVGENLNYVNRVYLLYMRKFLKPHTDSKYLCMNVNKAVYTLPNTNIHFCNLRLKASSLTSEEQFTEITFVAAWSAHASSAATKHQSNVGLMLGQDHTNIGWTCGVLESFWLTGSSRRWRQLGIGIPCSRPVGVSPVLSSWTTTGI